MSTDIRARLIRHLRDDHGWDRVVRSSVPLEEWPDEKLAWLHEPGNRKFPDPSDLVMCEIVYSHARAARA